MPRSEKLLVFIRENQYEGKLPPFYEAKEFPELAPLQANWKAIRDEIMAFEKRQGHIYGINSNEYVSAQFEGINWSNMYLENFMWRIHRNRKHFPLICSLVDQIPNCTLAVISVLSPHSSIKPHYGDTNGIIRCHLGISVPAPLPECGIRVGQEERGWANGEFTLFTEAHEHTAWNRTEGKRYVLIVDIVPRFIAESKIQVCSRVLGAQTFNYLEKRFPFLAKIPGNRLGIIHFFLTYLWRAYLPIQRRIKFL